MINRLQLVTALKSVIPGLSANEIIEQSSYFIFKKGRVYTYNDEVGMKCKTNLPTELKGAVHSSEILQYLERLNVEKIEVTFDSKNITIKGGKSTATFTLNKSIVIPLKQLTCKKDFLQIPDNLIDNLQIAKKVCTSSMERPLLTCVNVTKANIQASDGHRVCEIKCNSDFEMLLPHKLITVIASFKPDRYFYKTGWACFEKNGVEMIARTFVDNYPSILHLVKIDGELIQLPQNLKEIVGRAQIFKAKNEASHEYISITLTKKCVKIHSKNERTRYEEVADTKGYKGNDMTFYVNPSFLEMIFDKKVEVYKNKGRLLFKSDELTYVVALLMK